MTTSKQHSTELTELLEHLKQQEKRIDARRQTLFDLSCKCMSLRNGIYDGIDYDTPQGKDLIKLLIDAIDLALE
jgi:hypothetical protein